MDYEQKNLRIDENGNLEVAALSVLGGRTEQQDHFDYIITPESIIVSVCDGMGGHSYGEVASRTATKAFMDYFRIYEKKLSASQMLLRALKIADESVSKIECERGSHVTAGTTTVTILVEGNKLFWAAVGDSRLYIYRQNELLQITKDQNYKSVLTEWLQNGEISQEAFVEEMSRGEELISYLGLGRDLPVDYNVEPLFLRTDDYIVLMTDGLYRVLTDAQMKEVFNRKKKVEEITELLERQSAMAAEQLKIQRDNTTIVVLKVK